MGPGGGTGYAEAAAVDSTTIDAAAIGRESAAKARATANAVASSYVTYVSSGSSPVKQMSAKVLESGELFGIYPEGTRSPSGKLHKGHTGVARLGARVRPGWFAQTHEHPELIGRTLLEILHRGDDHRDGMGREAAHHVGDRRPAVGRAGGPFKPVGVGGSGCPHG